MLDAAKAIAYPEAIHFTQSLRYLGDVLVNMDRLRRGTDNGKVPQMDKSAIFHAHLKKMRVRVYAYEKNIRTLISH
jgi:hypothetical protein